MTWKRVTCRRLPVCQTCTRSRKLRLFQKKWNAWEFIIRILKTITTLSRPEGFIIHGVRRHGENILPEIIANMIKIPICMLLSKMDYFIEIYQLPQGKEVQETKK